MLLALPLLLLALLAVHAGAQGTLDQSNTQPQNGQLNIYSSTVWGQTFTAGLSGSLDTVAVDLKNDVDNIVPTSTVTVGIYTTDAGDLPASLLTSATTTVTNTANPTGPAQFNVVPFPAPTTVTAGQMYAIVVSGVQPAGNIVSWLGTFPSTYTRGRLATSFTGPAGPYHGSSSTAGSADFETFVTPPATATPTASPAPVLSGAPIVGALTVTVSGCGTTDPPGGAIYTSGLRSVVVTALPCPDSRFIGWTNGPCNGTTINPCDFPPMFAPVTANFAP